MTCAVNELSRPFPARSKSSFYSRVKGVANCMLSVLCRQIQHREEDTKDSSRMRHVDMVAWCVQLHQANKMLINEASLFRECKIQLCLLSAQAARDVRMSGLGPNAIMSIHYRRHGISFETQHEGCSDGRGLRILFSDFICHGAIAPSVARSLRSPSLIPSFLSLSLCLFV